jgi:hypothetical protein
MPKKALILLLAVLQIALCQGCRALDILNSPGRLIEREVDVAEFNGIEMQGFGTLHIEAGQPESLRIEGEDNIVEDIEVQLRDGTLSIRADSRLFARPRRPVHYYLTVRELERVLVTGNAEVDAPEMAGQTFQLTVRDSASYSMDGLRTEQLRVTIGGSGRAELDELRAEHLDLVISGSGVLDVGAGAVTEQVITISGSGEYQAEELVSQTADVQMLGSGQASISVRDALEVDIGGSGVLRYHGDPIIERNIAEAGELRQIAE